MIAAAPSWLPYVGTTILAGSLVAGLFTYIFRSRYDSAQVSVQASQVTVELSTTMMKELREDNLAKDQEIDKLKNRVNALEDRVGAEGTLNRRIAELENERIAWQKERDFLVQENTHFKNRVLALEAEMAQLPKMARKVAAVEEKLSNGGGDPAPQG